MNYPGFLIKRERLLKNWSQEGLCKGICAVSYLSKIEQGKAEASEEIISALFERLGTNWVTDKKLLLEGKKFVEDWYEAVFSADWDRCFNFLSIFKRNYSFLENSHFGVDIMLLKIFGEEETKPVDEKFEIFMDQRGLSLQRLYGGNFEEATKLFPCSYMFFRAGVSDYVKGDNAKALENLQRAYSLASEEGRTRVMLFSKLYITNCYSNICDIESMKRHGKIAKRIAAELSEPDLISTVDYNFAATKIEAGDFSGAYDYFSNLSEPSAPSLHKLAVCCEKLGRREEALLAIEKEKDAKAETDELKKIADEACEIIKFRLENEDYLSNADYGKLLLGHFEKCRKEMPIGYAKFHLPWVLEWYKANREYGKAFRLVCDFPQSFK